MRRTILAAVATLLVASPLEAQRKINEQYGAMPDAHVRVQLMAGSVRVTGWDRDSIAIRGVVNEGSGERFFVHRDKSGVKLGLWDPAAEKVMPSQIEVFVPVASQVWVKTASATVTVAGVTGGVDIGSSTGAIEVTGSPREIIAESLSGSVTVDARSRVTRIRTASGFATLRGNIVDATIVTVSGDVLIEASAIERGRFESVDGDIRYRGDVVRLASLDFINHSGDVELVFPTAAAAEIAVNTFEGSIDSALGVTPRRVVTKGKGTDETFVLNGGGAYLTVRSFKGATVLRRK